MSATPRKQTGSATGAKRDAAKAAMKAAPSATASVKAAGRSAPKTPAKAAAKPAPKAAPAKKAAPKAAAKPAPKPAAKAAPKAAAKPAPKPAAKPAAKAAAKAAPKPAAKTAPKAAAKPARKPAPKAIPAPAPAPAETPGRLSPELALPEVQTLLKMGKSKGNLTDDEISGALGDIDLKPEQIANVYEYFARSGVDVADVAVPEVTAEDEDMIIEGDEVSAAMSATAVEPVEVVVEEPAPKPAAVMLLVPGRPFRSGRHQNSSIGLGSSGYGPRVNARYASPGDRGRRSLSRWTKKQLTPVASQWTSS